MQPVPNEQPDESVRPVAEADLDAIEELSRASTRSAAATRSAPASTAPSAPSSASAAAASSATTPSASPATASPRPKTTCSRSSARLPARCRPTSTASLCPLTEGSLYRSFLGAGFRNIKVMNLMALGPYEDPDGAWLPSVLF